MVTHETQHHVNVGISPAASTLSTARRFPPAYPYLSYAYIFSSQGPSVVKTPRGFFCPVLVTTGTPTGSAICRAPCETALKSFTPFVRVGTYPTGIWPPYGPYSDGRRSPGLHSWLRSPLRLPSPLGRTPSPRSAPEPRSQRPVFGKQSLEPISCNLLTPPASRGCGEATEAPFLQRYGVSLPSSLTEVRSFTWGIPPAYRCRFAVRA